MNKMHINYKLMAIELKREREKIHAECSEHRSA